MLFNILLCTKENRLNVLSFTNIKMSAHEAEAVNAWIFSITMQWATGSIVKTVQVKTSTQEKLYSTVFEENCNQWCVEVKICEIIVILLIVVL